MSDLTMTTTPTPVPDLRPIARAAAVAIPLIAVIDWLIWRQPFGLNLVVAVAATALAVVLASPRRCSPVVAAIAAGLVVLSLLPLIEAPSELAVLLAFTALAVFALCWTGLVPADLTRLPILMLRYALGSAFRFFTEITLSLARLGGGLSAASMIRRVAVWTIPLILTGIFLLLLASANPLIELGLASLDPGGLLDQFDPFRAAFWLALAIVLWPLLRPYLVGASIIGLALPAPTDTGALFGTGALIRSLVAFNAVFAIETLLDLAYLWGGLQLPEGISHADYAHRGAYPLIATALLAAAFVLLATRPGGPWERSRLIRGLVYAWIAQNILLCVSALLRLELYVEAYSLTELRLAAAIWMGLVAVGLVLILIRIALRRSNTWLVATNLAVLVATLYACTFFDGTAIIARFNVEHRDAPGKQTVLDLQYLRELGPSAIPALDAYLATNPPDQATARSVRQNLADQIASRAVPWQGWFWRYARMRGYVFSHNALASPAASDNTLGRQ
jgi:hypothetical protein